MKPTYDRNPQNVLLIAARNIVINAYNPYAVQA